MPVQDADTKQSQGSRRARRTRRRHDLTASVDKEFGDPCSDAASTNDGNLGFVFVFHT